MIKLKEFIEGEGRVSQVVTRTDRYNDIKIGRFMYNANTVKS